MRAFSGAFLFGIPSLYTLETWELGTFTEPTKLLILLGIALLVSVTLAHFAGFRMEPPTLFRSVDQAVDAVAVGAVSAVVVLAVLSRIGPSETLQANVARVVIQIVPLSMGVAVANAVFARGRARQWEHSEQTGDDAQAPVGPWKATLGDVAATVVGAALLGFSIAPTEEIELIAAELGLANALALVALSLVSTHMIVFASAFDPERHLRRPRSVFRTPLGETLMAYVVSLLVAGLALYMFGRLDLSTPLGYILAQVLVLGLPAAVGGAAGRLVARARRGSAVARMARLSNATARGLAIRNRSVDRAHPSSSAWRSARPSCSASSACSYTCR
jgi:putative integral membrane protein (TIGR02587 family)